MIIHNLFFESSSNWVVQLFRYAIVGGIAFIADFGLLWLLTEFAHCHYIVAGSLSFIAGLLINYFLSTSWVFKTVGCRNRNVDFVFFAVIGEIGLAINAGLLYVLTDHVGIHYLISKLIATVVVFGWNFTARKFLLMSNLSIFNHGKNVEAKA